MSTATVAATGTMTAPMIFLSYRRDDSGGHVGRLHDALSAKFGAQRIFVDIDHIGAGQDFVQVVDDAVARCAVLVVVIGKRWAGTGRVGKRRIDNPGDFVRLEVAGGLRRQGLRMIPVLVGGAPMPSPPELPDDIKELARRNAFELSDTRWKEDVARLIAQLDLALGPATPPRTGMPSAVKTITLPVGLPQRVPTWGKWAASAVAVLIVVYLARGAFTHPATETPTAPVSAPARLSIAAEPPRAVPAQLAGAGRSVLASVQAWRGDAVLTQITARPQTGQGASGWEIDYVFRSPTDGAGKQVVTGVPGSAPVTKSLQPVSRSAIHALPGDFTDLPTAVQTARDSGLAGDVRLALISASFSRHAKQPIWLLRGTGSDSPFYVDATSGVLLHGTFSLASGANTGTPRQSGENPIQALKGLFHKH